MFLILSFQNATEPQTIPTLAPVMSLVIGVSVGLVILVLVIVVIVVIIILILVVMKKRNKDYVLQQSTESHGLTNTLYTGRWIMQAASCTSFFSGSTHVASFPRLFVSSADVLGMRLKEE